MFARVFKSTVMVSVVAFLAGREGCPHLDQQQRMRQRRPDAMLRANAQRLAGLLDLGDILGNIGMSCDPIDVLGGGSGANCQNQAVCCTNVAQDGFLNFGCSPVIVNL
ncbi:hypothetical protein JVT61DRAFT_8120 [Boletus reticuloceps]|uniref:Hydrophobin n=1 Tax=Boletus reticuloceps TaxID=495285 RepID=A0A8I2YXR4_9AGAM|nr:hypothetical protein JVT61DRAFT_8120 [Boletus reticuloceps]